MKRAARLNNEKRNVKGFNAIVRTTSENRLINKDLFTNCKPLESEFSKFVDDNFDDLI